VTTYLEQINAVAPNLTERDLAELSIMASDDPDALADVLDTYIDAQVVADRGVWATIAGILKAAEPYLGLASAILSVVTGVWGLVAP
jgi:hypothetical protein